MGSIKEYRDLISLIPVKKQSTIVKKEVWTRFSSIEQIKDSIFGSNDSVEISREDVLSESDTAKRIVMALMWGYPTGGRGNNIEKTLSKMDDLTQLLSSINEKDLTKAQARKELAKFSKINGLGASTWSKFLYFFNVSIDSRKCQIYDLKIVDSLNKKQFSEIGSQEWKQNKKQYYQYIELLDNLATDMRVLPEQVELFLFYFNLYYKFSD